MNDSDTKPRFDLRAPDAATELEAHIQSHLSGELREFRIDVQAEGLLLQGHARTYHARQQAEQEVRDATGLPILGNEIEVS
jgi:hypothetical protein